MIGFTSHTMNTTPGTFTSGKQKDKKTKRQKNKKTKRQKDKMTKRQKDKKTKGQKDKEQEENFML